MANPFIINRESCVECGQCRRFCPIAGAIIINQEYQHVIVNDACTGCGLCAAFCPVPGAITQTQPTPTLEPDYLKTLRRVVWRGKWYYHRHPLMDGVTRRARHTLRTRRQLQRAFSTV